MDKINDLLGKCQQKLIQDVTENMEKQRNQKGQMALKEITSNLLGIDFYAI